MESKRILEHQWRMGSWDIWNVVINRASYTSPRVNLQEFESHVDVTRRGDVLVLRSQLKMQDGEPLPPLMSSSWSCIDIDFRYENDRAKEARMESSRRSVTERTAVWEFDNIMPSSYFQYISSNKHMLLYITQQIILDPAAANTQNVTSPQQQLLPQKLNVDYATLLEKANFSDLVLVSATGKEFTAHKAILSARSPVFAAMLQSGMKESHENRITLENASDELLEAMLNFLYAGTLDGQEMRAGFYEELLAVADQYNVTDLRSAILEVIQINMDNFGKLLLLADRLGETNLRSRVFEFISLNRNELKNKEGSIF